MVNDPAVRPFVGPEDIGELDFAPLIRPENWVLMGEHGGFALLWSAPGVYEVHTFVLPSGRGQWARQAASDGIAYARENGARMLWTRVPPDLPHVAAYAKGMGMSPTGGAIETFGVPYDILSMEL